MQRTVFFTLLRSNWLNCRTIKRA